MGRGCAQRPAPRDSPAVARISSETPRIRVGVAGWSYEDWAGTVYPAQRSAAFDPLAFLAEYVDCIEINSSFYRPPKPDACASWVRRTASFPAFTFTAKLWRRFTHDRTPDGFDADAQRVRDALAPLFEADRCGALLIQFPWSFRRTRENATWLKRVCEAFAGMRPVVEVRHVSWNEPSVIEWCGRNGVSLCAIDQPMFDDSVDPRAFGSGPVGYVRLHGRNQDNWFRKDAATWERYDYLYADAELDPWVARIREIAEGSDESFVIANNHYRGQAVVNALEIRAALLGEPVPAPGLLRELYPQLQGKTRLMPSDPTTDGSADLFR